MVTLLRTELASRSCNYIPFLNSTLQYRKDVRKRTGDIHALVLRGGHLFALLKVINNSLTRSNPAFPVGTGPIASFKGLEDYVLGCPLISWHLCSCDQKHSQIKDLSPALDPLVRTCTSPVTGQNHHCHIVKRHASSSTRLDASLALNTRAISTHHETNTCTLQSHGPCTSTGLSTQASHHGHAFNPATGEELWGTHDTWEWEASCYSNASDPKYFSHIWKEESRLGRLWPRLIVSVDQIRDCYRTKIPTCFLVSFFISCLLRLLLCHWAIASCALIKLFFFEWFSPTNTYSRVNLILIAVRSPTGS